jgi:hypothetical protein
VNVIASTSDIERARRVVDDFYNSQSAEYARLIQVKDKWVTHQMIRYEFIYTICGLPGAK